jgi:hypothetical protein
MIDSNSARKLIKEAMPVVGSDHGAFAVVDHLEGTDTIKLTKDASGLHHDIPLDWVVSVDDKVHLDRTGEQAMTAWGRPPRAEAPDAAPPRHVNSVDATTGQPLVARVTARKQELVALRAALPDDDQRTRGDIDLALSTIDDLLTGDLDHVPAVVAAELNRWLEANKHVAERADEPAPAPEPPRITAELLTPPA